MYKLKEILEIVTSGKKFVMPANRLLPRLFLYKTNLVDLYLSNKISKHYIIESDNLPDCDNIEFHFKDNYTEAEFQKRVKVLLKVYQLFKYK